MMNSNGNGNRNHMPSLPLQPYEVIHINAYITAGTGLPPYLPYPLFLLTADLTQTARLLYALLLNRTTLSQKNGWTDEAGHIYIIFTIVHLADAINRSHMTVKNALRELEAAELIERKRQGFATPNHIFVKLPPSERKISSTMDKNFSVIGTENRPSHGQEIIPTIDRKLSPNHVNSNINNSNLRGESESDATALYGRYKNVSLTEAELAALQAEIPAQWQSYIDRLSEYMASTGRRYKGHLATIRRWAVDDATKNTPKQWAPDYTYEEGDSL